MKWEHLYFAGSSVNIDKAPLEISIKSYQDNLYALTQ